MPTKDLRHYLSLSYPIELRQNPEHGGFFAFHPDLEGCMAEGGTAEEAITNLADSRELWLEARLASGAPVPEPLEDEPSGRISLRMAPSLHASLGRLANRRGLSLNLLINTILAEHVGGVSYQAEMGELLEEMRSTLSDLRAQALPTPVPRRHAR
ncbi:MAG TPA: type II toxin-antitoxin system HicB family antitoxin [Thermoanaerobaculia bacterium]|nr:type II toxin-antitoxin system HicB family antitoxin [Thermoanaerobaculia bacterium]